MRVRLLSLMCSAVRWVSVHNELLRLLTRPTLTQTWVQIVFKRSLLPDLIKETYTWYLSFVISRTREQNQRQNWFSVSWKMFVFYRNISILALFIPKQKLHFSLSECKITQNIIQTFMCHENKNGEILQNNPKGRELCGQLLDLKKHYVTFFTLK